MTKQEIKGKHIYTYNGKVVRRSKRNYRFALLGAPRIALGATGDSEFRFIGLGNNAKNLYNSWKNIYSYCELKVIEIQ